MKKTLLNVIFLLSANLLVAYGKPILVMDGTPYIQMPNNFRTTARLKSPHAIGSGQFSTPQLRYVIRKIKHPIIVIDLRQESHGFVNGLPISWYGIKNWANNGKTPRQIEKIETSLLNKIKNNNNVTVCTQLKKTSKGIPYCTKLISLKVKTVSSEKDAVKAAGLKYYRFYVKDHSAPTTEQAKRFEKLIKTIPNNSWVYFHCRAGKGRTTTFMVLYDIIKNAKNLSLRTILAREYKIGGKDLTKIPNGYKKPLALQRNAFIKKLYWKYHTKYDKK